MESLGEYLKSRREEKNISLQHIAHITKINISYLQAIENNEFQRLPAPAFVRGFLRTYAQCIGLDPEDVILRLRLATGGNKETYVYPTKKRGFFKTYRLGIYGILFLLVVIGGLINQRFGKKHQQIRAITSTPLSEHENQEATLTNELGLDVETLERSDLIQKGLQNKDAQQELGELQRSEELQKPEQQPKPEELQESEGLQQLGEAQESDSQRNRQKQESELPASDVKQIAKPITLNIQAIQTTWIRVSIDTGPPFEVTLQPGDQVVWSGNETIFLKIGNAGGIKVIYDNKPMESLGETGEVVEISFPLPQE